MERLETIISRVEAEMATRKEFHGILNVNFSTDYQNMLTVSENLFPCFYSAPLSPCSCSNSFTLLNCCEISYFTLSVDLQAVAKMLDTLCLTYKGSNCVSVILWM